MTTRTPTSADVGAPEPWLTWQLVHTGRCREPEGLVHQGLRTRSPAVLEALALAASAGRDDASSFLSRVLTSGPPSTAFAPDRVRALTGTAMVWAGAMRSTDELLGAALVFEQLWSRGATDALRPEHHLVASQTLYLAGRHVQLEELLPRLDRIHPTVRHSLVTDLANPHAAQPVRTPGSADPADWPSLVARPFVEAGLASVGTDPALAPDLPVFDTLTATGVQPGSAGGELVTVVMPCYQPDAGLLTSVRSIARQTWADLEILIVDDASGPEYRDLFARAAALDDRARVVTMERNGGSYLGREAAIEQSRGAFVTFQDADDWSHPQRIQHQVEVLTGTSAPMSRSQAVRAKDDLTHQWLGYRPVRENASSLLVRRAVFDSCGGFIPVRKGADSEFAERVEALAGPVARTNTPLAVTRLRSGSLSRGDFLFSWFAPDRLTFRSAFMAWHRELRSRVEAGEPLGVDRAALHRIPFPVPTSYARGLPAEERTPDQLDRAYLGNFSSRGASTAARWLRDLLDASPPSEGLTGIWTQETPRLQDFGRPHLSAKWADLIHHAPDLRPLSRVEPVHVHRLVVVDPDVLSLVTGQPCRITADTVELWLSPEHVEPDGSLLPTDLLGLAEVCSAWWGVRPRWVLAPHLTDAQRQDVLAALPGLHLEQVGDVPGGPVGTPQPAVPISSSR